MAALLAGGVMVAWMDGGRSARDGAPLTVVTVEPGDSLWAIAVQRAPDADPRQTVDRIISRNGLRSPMIVPGQQLEVPMR